MGSAFSNMFGSVMTRLALIYGALALMTGAAIVVGWLVFQSIAANMLVLSEERLPELRQSAQVVSVADRLRAVLADKLIAANEEDLNRIAFKTSLIIRDIRSSVAALGEQKAASLQDEIDQVEAAFKKLKDARAMNFQSAENVAVSVREVMAQATEAAALLTQQTDGASFNLVIGSDDTIATIDTTLANLIEQDFALYQSTLEVRAEINLLSGLALSVSQTRDSAMLSILQDLADASSDRLAKVLAILEGNASTQELAVQTADAKTAFKRGIDRSGPRITPSEILALRQTLDAALSSALDDIYFDLVIKSDDAKTGNEDSIRNLMDVEVNRIRSQAALDSSTKSFFAAVMQTALSRNDVELGMRADELTQAEARLRDAMTDADDSVAEVLIPMLEIAAPSGGIISTRQASFEANSAARDATEKAALAVRDISSSINTFARTAQDEIYTSATNLTSEVQKASTQMQQIGIISAVLVALAPLLIWKMITSPLNHVTRVTERLANGDLTEITGLDGKKGEIGRMAAALKVFREGALERIEMQKQEARRQAEELEAERAAEQAKRDAEIQERQAEEARKREELARDARERERVEEARLATEAERQARAAEQEAVVSELAASLKHLSQGNFSHQITTEFPGNYETLRLDYNAAIANLAALVRKIGHSAGLIDGSSSEIAASSLDLSKRTENAAATLEETAAALSELTASVASAAGGASTASHTVEAVKRDAETSKEVMQEAVNAMSEIEQSSSKIAKIVEVIDSISFQTNLLALNAGVEAARAGDAGRGFAVVASEVRILAHRCSEAALQINELTRDSTENVENGVSMIGQTNEALTNILSGITEVSQHVADIAMSANEQSSGISEINVAVEQLDRSTQQNAAMFEETTAASQTLTAEASELSKVVSGFVVSDAQMSDGQWDVPDVTSREAS